MFSMAGSLAVPSVSADAPDADSAQQLPVRHGPDYDSIGNVDEEYVSSPHRWDIA